MSDDSLITATPLSLHPEVLTTLGDDHQADPVVGLMRDALSTARDSWQATVVGHCKVMQDPTRTEAANFSRSATAAHRRQQEALARLDAAIERSQREIGFINDAVNQVPDAPAPHVVRMVADSLRSLSADDRRAAIAEALLSGDTSVLGPALFVGPPLAYGLSRTERDVYRTQYQNAAYPGAMARRAALEAGVEKVRVAGQALIEAHSKLFDQKRLDAAAALARQAEEALGD